MQIIGAKENLFVINLARGEELFETLLSWAKANDIKSATLTGLGAADVLELAYYNLHGKKYERHEITDEVEILSLVGNLVLLQGERTLHIHGVFGRRDLTTLGGHVFKLRVSGACEIHLTTFESPFERRFDEATGLNLLCKID
jgi:predicted DNA-binding protein with PD1-like motif